MEKLAIVIDIQTLRSIKELKQELAEKDREGDTIAAQGIAIRLANLYFSINVDQVAI